MSLRNILSIAVTLLFAEEGIGGCLEPQKDLFQGSLAVERCSYHTVTDGQYDDPRLSDSKMGKNPYKNPTDILAVNRKMGKEKIFSLSAKDKGVLLAGKIPNQDKRIIAFLRTKDPNFCDKFIKTNIAEVSVVEMCCDCQNSCIETPCALGTKNEITKYKLEP